jgi:predicted nucleotidyltransferase
MLPGPARELAEYGIGLAGLRKEGVRFVILNGSAGEGTDRAHSDYDLAVVTRAEKARSEYWGRFNGRPVSL